MRYFDLHCDTIGLCALRGIPLRRNELDVSLEQASAFDRYAQAFACWIPDTLRGKDARQYYERLRGKLVEETAKNADLCRLCRTGAEMEQAFSERKIACLLTVEGSAALGGDLDAVDELRAQGVAMMTLTWNGRCEAGDGSGVPDAGGLTPFGRALVARMERCGMVVDVSHLSDRGFADVAEISGAPFVATHSNSRAVCPHRRNLTDAQFREIVRRGGLVGLNVYPPFIRPDGRVRLRDLLPHIDRFLELGGERVLAVGSDFDGAVSPSKGGKAANGLPRDLPGLRGVPEFYRMAVRRYGAALADRIFFENARAFFANRLTNPVGCGMI